MEANRNFQISLIYLTKFKTIYLTKFKTKFKVTIKQLKQRM